MTSQEVLARVRSNYQRMAQVDFEVLGAMDYIRAEAAKRPLKNFLEIGSDAGGSLACFSAWSEGKRISIDLPWTGVLDSRRKNWAKDFGEVYEIIGSSHLPETLDLVRSVLGEEKCDVMFIDGDHTYEGVKKDFELYLEFASPNAIIAFHDTVDSERHHRENCYVDQLWRELTEQYYSCEWLGGEQWGGVGLVDLGRTKTEGIKKQVFRP